MENKDYIDMDDLFVDNVLGDLEKERKPKVKSKRKGNRVELELCKKLTEHFGEEFSRSVGSGNRWGQVNYLPEHARKTLVGDICVPEKFKWVIECKGGYDKDVDFSSVLDGGCARIDEFIEQSLHDHEQCGRLPIIFWKRSRKPWICMARSNDLYDVVARAINFYFSYKSKQDRLNNYSWTIVSADALLKATGKPFWFEK
jgi:hypothetical protein